MNNKISNISKLIPIVGIYYLNKEYSIVVTQKNLLTCLNFLKNHINYKFSVLSCVSGVDIVTSEYRFAVVYDLLSIKYNLRLKVKVFVNEVTAVPTAISIYKNANWWEREVWDMYGVYFQDHPDLRRILTDYGFEGYPLRKDFPLSGYVEVRYDFSKKRIVVEPLELAQEFRSFEYETPW